MADFGAGYVFAVDAKMQSKKIWPYLIASAGAVGGIIYFLNKPTEPKTGTISITVPGDF